MTPSSRDLCKSLHAGRTNFFSSFYGKKLQRAAPSRVPSLEELPIRRTLKSYVLRFRRLFDGVREIENVRDETGGDRVVV